MAKQQKKTKKMAVGMNMQNAMTERINRLQKIIIELSNVETYNGVADVVLKHAFDEFRAKITTISRLDIEKRELQIKRSHGYSEKILEENTTASLDIKAPLTDAIKMEKSVWLENRKDIKKSYPMLLGWYKKLNLHSGAYLPLIINKKVTGGLAISFEDPHIFQNDERQFLETLALQSAQALDRAKLHEEDMRRTELLKQNKERLENIVKNVPGIVWERMEHKTVDMNLDFVSDTITSTLGYTNKEYLKNKDFWNKITHPDDKKRVKKERDLIFRSGKSRKSRFRLITKNGKSIEVEEYSSVIFDENGTPIGMRGVTMDITGEAHVEKNLRFLAEVNKTLASSLDYEKTLHDITYLAVPDFADWCSIDIIDEKNGILKQLGVAHKDPKKVKWAKALRKKNPPNLKDPKNGLARVLRTGKSELYSEITEAMIVESAKNKEELKLIRNLGFVSAILVPLTVRNKNIGVITLVTTESGRKYTHFDLTTAEKLATRASIAIENARLYDEAEQEIAERLKAEENLKKSEEQYRMLMEHASEGIFVSNRETKILDINEAACRILGFKKSEIINTKMIRLIFPKDKKRGQNHLKLLEKGKTTLTERQVKRKDGKMITIERSAKRLSDGRIVSIIRNITERKKTEEELRIRAREQATVSELGVEALAGIPVESLMKKAISLLVETLSLEYGAILKNFDGKGIFIFTAGNGWNKTYRLGKSLIEQGEQSSGAFILKSEKPVITFDFKKEKRFKVPDFIHEHRIKSGIGIKIPSTPYFFGTLSVYSTKCREFSRDDIHFIQSIANIIASAIERKQYEGKIKESELRFQAMADSAPALIWISGIDRIPNYFNKGWLTYTGKVLEEEFGNKWLEGVHPDDVEAFKKAYNNSFDEHKEFKIEYRLRRHDGGFRWILSTCIPRYSSDNMFEGYICAGIDINEIKESESRKDEFISMASHELKTPVTSLRLYTELLKRQLQDSSGSAHFTSLEKMNAQIGKLTNLINDLLNLSNIQAGKLQFREQIFDLNELVKEIVKEIQSVNKQHTIILEGKVKKKIEGDKDRIGQVVINLLTNAIKYSPKANKVIVELSENEGGALVKVKDFGIGITEEHQHKIFDRFYQVVNGNSEKTFPGLGIGLYIASEIIKRHKGKLWVESIYNKGSTFTFSLPLESNLYEK